MDIINDDEVLIIKKKRATRQPKSEITSNPQQLENTEIQDPETQKEPTIKAKTTSRAKKSKSEQPTTEPSQENQTAKPKAKAKAAKPRTRKSQQNQTTTQNGEEEAQQQPKKVVDTIVVDI